MPPTLFEKKQSNPSSISTKCTYSLFKTQLDGKFLQTLFSLSFEEWGFGKQPGFFLITIKRNHCYAAIVYFSDLWL